MKKKKVSVIILDFDNTLFDWVEVWYQSFSAMLHRLSQDSGIPEEILIPEIKQIHERHGTSEYAFLFEEIPSLIKKHPNEDIPKIYEEAINEYRKARKNYLHLYPGVRETLCALKQQGCLLVIYTESLAFYTNYRIRRLELDGVIDILYSPCDHDLPANLTREQIRLYPAEHYKFVHTEHRFTPKGELKPNPGILHSIITDIRANKDETIYVGDSLMKDVLMAQRANTTDVFAKYGTAQHRQEYELLRKVTHWTKEDVEREKETKETITNPSHVLLNNLDEIFTYFHFIPFMGKKVINNDVTNDVIAKSGFE